MSPCATASTHGTSASSPTAQRVRCCFRRLSTCCRRGGSSSHLTPGCSRRSGCSAPTSSTTAAAAPTSMLAPDAAPAIAAVFEQMEAQLRARSRRGHEATVRRSFDGRLMGQSWETPFVELPEGPIDEAMIAHDGLALPRTVRAPLRQSLRLRSRAGRHVSRAADRSVREGRVLPQADRRRDTRSSRIGVLRAALLTTRTCSRWASTVARTCRSARASTGRRSSARNCRRRSSARSRRPRSAASARS